MDWRALVEHAVASLKHVGHLGIMARSGMIIGIAVILAALLVAVGVSQWSYLDRGYSLGVSLNGGPSSVSHIDFPTWRKAMQVIIWAAAFTALWMFANGGKRASLIAWLTFVAVLSLGAYDVTQYGTIGSPTSKWAIMLFLGLAVVVQIRSKLATLDP